MVGWQVVTSSVIRLASRVLTSRDKHGIATKNASSARELAANLVHGQLARVAARRVLARSNGRRAPSHDLPTAPNHDVRGISCGAPDPRDAFLLRQGVAVSRNGKHNAATVTCQRQKLILWQPA
jgi:hypothetical protein